MTHNVVTVIAAFRSPARLAGPARNRNTCVPFEVWAMGLFKNGSRGQTGAQRAEGKDEGGAEMHDNVLEIGDGLYEVC